jgi:glycosyltransferase involved in cell wall biosynthesis
VVHEWKPDAIVAHHTLANGFLAHQIKRKWGIPFVTIDWDFGEVNDCAHLPHRARTFQKIADTALCSIAVAKRMEESLRRIFPAIRTRTIHSGVEGVSDFMGQMPEAPELHGKTVIFSAGIFYERKGFPLLVEAFALVAARHPNAVLRIAGDGATRPAVEAIITQHGLQERVQLLGLQPYKRVLQEMARADIFALIGWDEPFATVFMEAMSARCPIVCANDGGVNDLLRDGVHGRALPPRDVDAAARALDELLGDTQTRERMGNAARELFEAHLTSDATARAILGVFEGNFSTPSSKLSLEA